MAKYLSKPCVNIMIITLQVSRKQIDEEAGEWQTSVVLMGEALDEDGKVLESIHRKYDVGPICMSCWDGDSIEADLATVAGAVKAKCVALFNEYTIP